MLRCRLDWNIWVWFRQVERGDKTASSLQAGISLQISLQDGRDLTSHLNRKQDLPVNPEQNPAQTEPWAEHRRRQTVHYSREFAVRPTRVAEDHHPASSGAGLPRSSKTSTPDKRVRSRKFFPPISRDNRNTRSCAPARQHARVHPHEDMGISLFPKKSDFFPQIYLTSLISPLITLISRAPSCRARVSLCRHGQSPSYSRGRLYKKPARCLQMLFIAVHTLRVFSYSLPNAKD